MLWRILWPIVLLLIACLAAMWLAYGLDPLMADHFGGLRFILLTRHLQWVLLTLSILPCLVLVVLVALNRSRAIWLLGLSIVVAMLFVRFSPSRVKPVRILDGPTLPPVAEARNVLDEEFVVGLTLDDVAYAFPYRSLVRTPIVQLTDFDQRVILIASPYANSAIALDTTRQTRAEDWEYVASPDNSTLVYDRKYGQFILGITGQTPAGQQPIGVRGILPVTRVQLRDWRKMYPTTRIMLPTEADMAEPGMPLAPLYEPKMPDSSLPAETPVILLHTDPPVALPQIQVEAPIMIKQAGAPIVLWRVAGELRAFNRIVDGDYPLNFAIKKDHAGKLRLVDTGSGSVWSYDGSCSEGRFKGKKLTPVRVEENVYWGVCKTWWPELKMLRP